MNKYGAKRTIVDGITFDSKFEARCYSLLKLLERAGEVRALKLQPRFDIVVNGVKVCTYVADFSYQETRQTQFGPTWDDIIADAKGVRTRDYRLKVKLMKAVYGVDIVEFVAGKRLPGQRRT